jgi:iron(III) transport system substrate-binding protein
VRVERSGAERIFQRIAQEQGSGIHEVDVANSTDPAHYLDWKKHGWLAPYVPDDVAKHFPADQVDADGMHATSCAWTEAIGYNTNLVKREDAPKATPTCSIRSGKARSSGSSRLQRRYPDRDLRARARSGLAIS